MSSFLTTTGYGLQTVEVSYDIDDGIVFDVEVRWKGIEVSGLLSEDVINDIELECYQNERKLIAAEIAEFNLDRGQKQYEDMRDMREGALV